MGSIKLDKFINTGALKYDSIFHMALKHIGILLFGIKTLDFAIHCCGPHYIMFLIMY